MKLVYTERQQFRNSFFIFPVIGVSVVLIVLFGSGIYTQIVSGKPFGNNPMSDTGLIITTALVIFVTSAIIGLLVFMRLETRIDRETISFRFVPFHRSWHIVRWNEVTEANVVTYNPIGDYGGWGIGSGKKGKAYNVKGNKGLLIRLKSGKNILLGTQQNQNLKDFLSRINQEKTS